MLVVSTLLQKKKSLVKSVNVLQHDAIVQLQKHDLSPVLSKGKTVQLQAWREHCPFRAGDNQSFESFAAVLIHRERPR